MVTFSGSCEVGGDGVGGKREGDEAGVGDGSGVGAGDDSGVGASGGATSEIQDESNIIDIISKANSRNLIVILQGGKGIPLPEEGKDSYQSCWTSLSPPSEIPL